jgi:hypothetical protein
MKTLWPDLKHRRKDSRPSNLAGGINNGAPIIALDNNQASDMSNMDSWEYPSLCTRSPRGNKYNVLTGPVQLLTNYKDQYLMALANGGLFKPVDNLWSSVATGFSTAICSAINYMDDLIIADGVNRLTFVTSAGAKTVGTQAPMAKYVIQHANRLYAAGIEGEPITLRYNALRVKDDWTTPNQAGEMKFESGAGAPITGLAAFQQHVMVFKANFFSELYGTGPSNYQAVDGSHIGTLSHHTIKEVNRSLIWLADREIVRYYGGVEPKVISDKIRGYIHRINWDQAKIACAGVSNNRYYISLPIDGATQNNLLLVYDSDVDNWYVHDNWSIVQFASLNGRLYAIDKDGQVKEIDSDTATEEISWSMSTKLFHEGAGQKMNIQSFTMLVDLPTGSTLNLDISPSDQDLWENLGTFQGQDGYFKGKLIVPVPTGFHIDWYKLRISGTGPCTIHELSRTYRVK